MHFIRRPQWESLERCVERVKEADTFNASWVSGAIGVSVTAVIGFVTVLLTSSHKEPHSVGLTFLALLAVAGAAVAIIVYKIEDKARKLRVSHLDALKEEMAAAKHYMVDDGT
jgi:ABC-type Fe3+-siderophore transport system permease subunit